MSENKKNLYKVVYSLSYEIEADTTEEAEETAFDMFLDDVENAVKFSNLAETFGSNVEEIMQLKLKACCNCEKQEKCSSLCGDGECDEWEQEEDELTPDEKEDL